MALLGCQPLQPEQSDSAQTQDELIEYAMPNSLIEPEELQLKIYDLTNTRLIDVRKHQDYAKGHITGSINVWRDQIVDTSYSYGGMMATKEQMEQLFGELGISPTDTLILYDAKADVDAARLWWILKYYGHKHIRLLNGGLKAWQSIGGELEYAQTEVTKTEYYLSDYLNPEIIASIEDVRLAFEIDSNILLDTRTEEEYSGEIKKNGAARAGAIESAVNLDWSTAVDYDGDHRFRSANELREIYGELGINANSNVITYCHSGVRSAHTLFVLHQLLGYPYIRNYDGSWTEWSYLVSE